MFHLRPIVLSGTQNCPIPIRQFRDKIWNLGPCHLLDITTKEKPAKFQTKRTAGSKVLRLCNFCAPKRAQIGPVWSFPVFQVEIPRNHGHRPNLKRNRFKFLHLGPTELSVPKLPHPPPKPLFSEGNWKFERWQSEDIKEAAELAKFQIRPRKFQHHNPSQKLLRQMRKTVLFRLATSNVKLFLETIWSG